MIRMTLDALYRYLSLAPHKTECTPYFYYSQPYEQLCFSKPASEVSHLLVGKLSHALNSLSEPYFLIEKPSGELWLGLGKAQINEADTRNAFFATIREAEYQFECHHMSHSDPAFPVLVLQGFDEHPDQRWVDSPYGFVWQPRLLLHITNQQSELFFSQSPSPSCNHQDDQYWQQIVKSLIDSSSSSMPMKWQPLSHLQASQSQPDLSQWRHNIDTAKKTIKEGKSHKIVLARRQSTAFNASSDSLPLYLAWRQQEPKSTGYYIKWTESLRFFGCSPETLFKLNGKNIETEALAGTAKRGNSNEQNEWIASKLLLSDKNTQENAIVHRYIVNQLQPLTQEPIISNPMETKYQSKVLHLRRPIEARLKSDACIARLLEAMHPTPAVAGTPLGFAQRFIREHEGFARGWYAGCFGMMTGSIQQPDTQMEINVALRCAKSQDHQLDWYAGAGIVLGSDSRLEYIELDNKTLGLQQLLFQTHRQRHSHEG